MPKPATTEQVLQGTLDLLVPETLSREPLHGWRTTTSRRATHPRLTAEG
jgi:hypothetical protein